MIRISIALLSFFLLTAASPDPPPAWAYVTPAVDAKPKTDDGKLRQVPNSSATYSFAQVTDRFVAPDWHPADHPKMPAIVAHGRKPDVFACGYCHRADGPGGPENASLAGLPYDYILEQMADYKSGRRSTALPQRLPQSFMISLAKAATDDEIHAAARYFSSLKPRQNIRVVEASMVPQTRVAGWVLTPHEAEAKSPLTREPIGRRIVEMPEDLDRFESRDTHATFVAYAPPGSLRAGAALVRGETLRGEHSGTPPCATCHGKDHRGHELAPSIAGRSPSYIVRQLYEFQTNARVGKSALLMRPAAARLTEDDRIAIAAYLATLKP